MESDDSFKHFIAGFVSGEGSFFVSLQRNNAYRTNTQVVCGFSIKVRADDRELIDQIWRAFDFAGNVHEISAERYRYEYDTGLRRNDAVMYIVRKLSDLIEHIIPFFDMYPLHGRKRENYELWKQVVYLVEQGKHLTTEGLQDIAEIKAQMNRY
jgi:hypothetical protein